VLAGVHMEAIWQIRLNAVTITVFKEEVIQRHKVLKSRRFVSFAFSYFLSLIRVILFSL